MKRKPTVQTGMRVATVHVFGVQRPIDSAPFYLAFTDLPKAQTYPHRITRVVTVDLPVKSLQVQHTLLARGHSYG